MFEQISIFDMIETESRFTHEVKTGSGFEGGKVRIFCASLNLGIRQLAEFLKDEYGTGGHSASFPDGGHGFTDYNPKGLTIREWKSNETEYHSWTEVAKEVKRLIIRNEYLTEKETEKAKDICRRNGGPAPVPNPRMRIEVPV